MVRDVYTTGPALLIGVLASVLVSIVQASGFNLWMVLGEIGLWLLSVLMVTIAGRLLGGTGDFLATRAHKLKSWRSLLLPMLFVVVLFVGAFILEVLVAGLEFTLDALGRNLGLVL